MSHRGFNRQWAEWGMGGPGRQGPPPWVAGLFGLGQGEERRGPRVRRGDVRTAILSVLTTSSEVGDPGAAAPMNGYQVMQQIERSSGGAWKPSPGSVYPTIQQLQDEGLLDSGDDKVLRLTDAGRSYVTEHADELQQVWAPFQRPTHGEEGQSTFATLRPEIGQVMSAAWQVISSGSPAQQRAAVDVLVDTRRRLYGILADGDEALDDADRDTDRDTGRDAGEQPEARPEA